MVLKVLVLYLGEIVCMVGVIRRVGKDDDIEDSVV